MSIKYLELPSGTKLVCNRKLSQIPKGAIVELASRKESYSWYLYLSYRGQTMSYHSMHFRLAPVGYRVPHTPTNGFYKFQQRIKENASV